MKDIDLPVKLNGKLYRLITKDGHGALFNRGGVAKKLTVSGGDVFPAMSFADEAGDHLKLTRTGKPCSCKGKPWTQSGSALRGEL